LNETLRRFGYPGTLVADYEHWVVLLRPTQPTLGSLILAAKGAWTAFSDLPPEAFSELHRAVTAVEATLGQAVRYSHINYLMLMMVDPHVHFHVLPRYEGERSAWGITVADAGWPSAPALGAALTLSPAQTEVLVNWLAAQWPTER
jgi:diadenosine tetraphosphate (Ap4A) HIT family hydrolase